MEKDLKDIRLTPEQYRELLKTYLIGNLVREDVLHHKNEKPGELHVLESYLLSFAADFKAEDIAEFRKDELLPSRELEDAANDVLDDYEDHQFWHRLEEDLAERDFRESATVEEWRGAEASGLWPDRMKALRELYHKEFHEHGSEKLRIEKEKEK